MAQVVESAFHASTDLRSFPRFFPTANRERWGRVVDALALKSEVIIFSPTSVLLCGKDEVIGFAKWKIVSPKRQDFIGKRSERNFAASPGFGFAISNREHTPAKVKLTPLQESNFRIS